MITRLFPLASFKALLLLMATLVVLLALLSCTHGWPKYFRLKSAKSNLSQRLAKAATADQQIKELSQQLNQGSNGKSYESLDFIAEIMRYCEAEKIRIFDFPEEQLHQQNSQSIVTNELKFEGDYHQLVELAYFIEREKKLSSISSIHFEKKRDKKRKRNKLVGKLILRNITFNQPL